MLNSVLFGRNAELCSLYTVRYVCIYTHILQIMETGQTEEIKSMGQQWMQNAEEDFPHAILGMHAIGSSALPSRISWILNRNFYHIWTASAIIAKCWVDTGNKTCRIASIEFVLILMSQCNNNNTLYFRCIYMTSCSAYIKNSCLAWNIVWMCLLCDLAFWLVSWKMFFSKLFRWKLIDVLPTDGDDSTNSFLWTRW
jgi:hypothetical protein